MRLGVIYSVALSLSYGLGFAAGPRAQAADAAPPAASPSRPDSVVLLVPHGARARSAGWYVALDRGLYAREGLAVELREGLSERDACRALVDARADFAAVGPEALRARLSGQPLVLVAPVFQHSSRALLARRQVGPQSPAELARRRIAMGADGADVEILAMLRAEGVDLAGLPRVAATYGLDDLAAGRIDALAVDETEAPHSLAERGVAPLVIRPIAYGVDFYGDGLVTTESQVRDHAARVAAFRRASLEGWAWAMAHTAEVADGLYARRGEAATGLTRERFRFETNAVRGLVVADLVELGHSNPGRWRQMADTYASLDLAPKGASLAGFLYDPSPPGGGSDWLRWVTWALAAALGIAGYVGLWSVVLRRQVATRTRDLAAAHVELVSEARERRNAEAAVRAVLESLPVGVVIADAAGRIVESNAAARALAGGVTKDPTADGVAGTGALSADDRPLARALRDGLAVPATAVELRLPDGRTRTVLSSAVPLRNGESDAVVGGVAVLADITERVELEQRLMQAQKMEAIGRLAGGVAHDFNNLLTVIGGCAQLALGQAGTHAPVSEALETIRTTSDRAAALTQRLLAFSRRQLAQPRVLDLGTTLAEMHALLRRLLGEDVLLVTTVERDLGRVRADPAQVEQVVMNLAVNARDAMPKGGRLAIDLYNEDGAEFDGEPQRNGGAPHRWVCLELSDTGTGMDASTRARLFEPYFTTKERGRGTGLGLSIVDGIVRQAGGRVEVETEVGRGTCFRVYFPRTDSTSAPANGTHAPPRRPRRGSESILLVEDDASVRDLAARVLSDHGYHVLSAAGPVEARLIGSRDPHPIHLLLTDVVMPKEGGRDLARALTAQRKGMRVLYMSGYLDDEALRADLLDKETAFLRKPFSPDGLLQEVREVLDAPAG